MTGLTSNISMITLNIQGPYIPMKRQRLAEWIKKSNVLSARNSIKCNTGRQKVKGCKKMYHADINSYKIRTGYIKSDKADF